MIRLGSDANRRVRRALFWLVCGAIAVLIVAPGALDEKNEKLSNFDEATHLDNAWRWAHFDIPQKGEPISDEILSEWTCRGFYDTSVEFPDCTAVEELDDVQFPISVSNYNTKHPPIYYVVNGFSARALVTLTPVDSFVSAARLANAVWVLLVFVAVSLVSRQLGLTRSATVAIAALAALVPVALWRWTYVNNDVASYTTAWFITAAALRVRRVGLAAGLPALTIASVIGTFTKGFTIGAVIGATILILPDAFVSGRTVGDRLRSALRALTPGILGTLAVIGWLVFQRIHRSDIPYVPPFIREPPVGIPWARISEQVVRLDAPVGTLPTWLGQQSSFFGVVHQRWLELTTWLLSLSAAFLAIGGSERSALRSHRSLGVAALLSPPALAALIITFNLADGSPVFIRIISRYHMSVLPLFIVALAAFIATRPKLSKPVTLFLLLGLGIESLIYLTATI